MKRYTGDPAIDALIARHIRYGQTRWAEVWCSIIMLAFGVFLLTPVPTFSAPGYSVISRFVYEGTAGGIALAVGAARVAALIINGRKGRQTSLVRTLGCMGGFVFWLALAIGFAWSAPPLPALALAVCPVLAVAELHSSSRAASDMAAEDTFGLRRRLTKGSQNGRTPGAA